MDRAIIAEEALGFEVYMLHTRVGEIAICRKDYAVLVVGNDMIRTGFRDQHVNIDIAGVGADAIIPEAMDLCSLAGAIVVEEDTFRGIGRRRGRVLFATG